MRLLRAAWPSISHAVKTLYEGSLRLNHFPNIFKLAEVIRLLNPGRNLSIAKGWRPIALFSFLGKVLEGFIAKRISYTSLSKEVVPQILFSALSV